MTKKDLFKIILKLYGLYSIIEVIIQIPSIGLYLHDGPLNEFNWPMLVILIVNILVVFILLLKPEWVVDLFKLDKGFENNDIQINNFEGKSITKIALIIIAIHLIVTNIGDFISQVLFSFKESIGPNSLENALDLFVSSPFNYHLMISSGISLVIGFLLLTNHKRLSVWIENINNKNTGDQV